MTAFARAEKNTEHISATTEIRSYNSRYLDISLRLPHGYLPLEEKIKGLISDRINRGRIEVMLQIRNDSEGSFSFEINEPRARAYHEALIQLKETFNIESGISLDLLTAAGDVIKPAEKEIDLAACWTVVEDCLGGALDLLVDMRKREGAHLAEDITRRLNDIEKFVRLIEQDSDDILMHYQERLKNRIAALTMGAVEIEAGRIAQEAAFLAERSDISEEIVRVASHIKQFRSIMASGEPGGRKLNFLLQEFNREFNTIGSKTDKAAVSHMIVDVKSELEKIREQIQNVE
jgi:uncharacterized protein (TIGR00255 family)